MNIKMIVTGPTESAYFISGGYSNSHWSISKKDTVITDFRDNLTDDALFIAGNASDSSKYIVEGIPGVRTVTYSDVSMMICLYIRNRQS